MGNVRFVSSADVPLISTRDRAPAATLAKLSEGERNTATRMLFPGSDRELQLFEVEVQPDDRVEVHAHAHDEIIYVCEGELRFGRRVCGAGSAVYISAHTLYGFAAGPSGCHFLNFRAVADASYISREEHLQSLRASSAAPGEEQA